MAMAYIPQPQAATVMELRRAGPDELEMSELRPADRPRAMAAAAPSCLTTKAWAVATAAAFGAAAVAFVVAYWGLLPGCQRTAAGCQPNEVFRVSTDLSMFSGLFVLALAVERLLQPFSRFIGPDTEAALDERDRAGAAAAAAPEGKPPGASEATEAIKNPSTNMEWLAAAQARVDRARRIGVIVHWGAAVAISFLLAGQLNVLLLAAVAAEGSASPEPWADLLVTGLVIGAGTKPLHDLVSRLEKSKEKKQDPPSTGGGRT